MIVTKRYYLENNTNSTYHKLGLFIIRLYTEAFIIDYALLGKDFDEVEQLVLNENKIINNGKLLKMESYLLTGITKYQILTVWKWNNNLPKEERKYYITPPYKYIGE